MIIQAQTKDEVDLCPIRQVLARATGKWQVLIFFALCNGPLRFGQLKRAIGDISSRVLTENVRSMERDGYLDRMVDPGPPTTVTYKLTDRGANLAEVLKQLAMWANTNFADISASRVTFDAAIGVNSHE
ncbi:winged helix-turn-helix transcriptional regulator [Ruegeria atlantica]|uniref:winged helix-turn-helix transcriptional regulator n=1 Tax=Ruegeria atlantica TaxID=81569 RepID=UPI002494C621|nr:helix-turn-helix domain-containing protein [Ruegeria atlantica]